MNTSLKQKIERWPEFIAACESQWKCGGTRYALTDDKEFTDLVCEAAGNQWIAGTIIKYCGEIINLRRAGEPVPEVNFFKIAVYGFLWWLKEQENLTQRDKGEEFSTEPAVVSGSLSDKELDFIDTEMAACLKASHRDQPPLNWTHKAAPPVKS